MAWGPAALALLGGGLSIGNSFLNRWFQGQDMQNQQGFNMSMANKQMAWNEQMQSKQWQQQMDFWNQMNQYNSPQSQMARFKQAGLNPHLIYGQGNAGNAASQTVPDVKPYSRAEASNHVRGLDVFGDYNRFQNIHAQTNNLEAQTSLAEQNSLLTAQRTANEAIVGKRGELDYGIAKELKDTQIEAAKANLERTQQEVRKSSLDVEYLKKTLSPRIRKVTQELDNLVEEGKIKQLDKRLKQWEVELSKSGLTKNDSRIWRLLENYKDELKEMMRLTPGMLKDGTIKALKYMNPYSIK